jgi:hypothetical protein
MESGEVAMRKQKRGNNGSNTSDLGRGFLGIRLTPSETAELNAAVTAIDIRGARLPDQVLVFSGVEAPARK